jgi:hypothetical protein
MTLAKVLPLGKSAAAETDAAHFAPTAYPHRVYKKSPSR